MRLSRIASLSLLAAGATAFNSIIAGNFTDVSTNPLELVDSFVAQWKLQHPDLTVSQVAAIHETAESMKQNLLHPVQHVDASSLPTKNASAALSASTPSRKQFMPRAIRRANTTSHGNSTLARAREIVRIAQLEASRRNKERLENPRTNHYYDSHGKTAHKARRADNESLCINQTVADAIAIVTAAPSNATRHNDYSKYFLNPEAAALANVTKNSQNVGNSPFSKRDGGSWWMETISHEGIVPFGGSGSSGYKVFRNVKSYGAVGDGVADDTDAIQKAVSDGDRCGASCGSSTVKPAIVYFPPGIYKVRVPIELYYNTQMIGDARTLPVIKAAESFVGLGVVSSDVYTGGNGGTEEWYINQNNFLRQVRNFIIDTSEATTESIAGLHWQVAQATSVFNVNFYGSSSKKHIGIFAENGSGGFMSNLVFKNMDVGIRCGNQQFTTMHLSFENVGTAVDLLWDWGWTWMHLTIYKCKLGFNVAGDYRGGSMMLTESVIQDTDEGIHVSTPKGSAETEQFSLNLHVVYLIRVNKGINHEPSGTVYNPQDGIGVIYSWILGKVYDSSHLNGTFVKGSSDYAIHDTSNLKEEHGRLYTRAKPQYEDKGPDFFLNAHFSAKGDGVTDDTFALQLAIAVASRTGRGLYIPFGSYMIRETLLIPPGMVIVGECWAQIVASGSFFQDIANPEPLVQVGNTNDSGSVEIQDLLFTTQGPTAGVILMEWNVKENLQGSAAMWDTHFRIGGAAGSHLQASNCPKLTGSVNKNCIAGAMMLHLTKQSSAYLENVWAWTADHDLDSGPDQTQIDIYVARGILIESRSGPVWLYGTSSEHAVLYQYSLYGASNVLMAMIQTESPYYLPDPQAPTPFQAQLNSFAGDPTFDDCASSETHCAAAWGLNIVGSSEVYVYGAGLYNWFQKYIQPCVDTQDCQKRVINISKSGPVWLSNVYTIGTQEMITFNGKAAGLAKDNTNTNMHPFTSVINSWQLAATTEAEDLDVDKDDGIDWDWNPDATGGCDLQFNSIEQLSVVYNLQPVGAIADFASHLESGCMSQYLAKIYYHDLQSALEDYKTMLDADFHRKFGVYYRIVKGQLEEQLLKYMVYDKSPHWQCSQPDVKLCCGLTCPSNFASGSFDPRCNTLNCTNTSPETQCLPSSDKLVPCPNKVGAMPDDYTWILQDKAGFNKVIEDDYGVPPDWIDFVDVPINTAYGCAWIQAHEGEEAKEMARCIKENSSHWKNYPQLKEPMPLPDPSDIIGKRFNDNQALLKKADSQMYLAEAGLVSWVDIADGLFLPSAMTKAAMEQMRKIAEMIDEKEAAERKEALTAVITGIFLLIPGIGSIAGSLGLATLRIIINVAGELANTAYSIYDAITTGGDALGIVMNLAFAGISIRPFRKAAQEMRALRTEKIEKLPASIKDNVYTARRMQFGCGDEEE